MTRQSAAHAAAAAAKKAAEGLARILRRGAESSASLMKQAGAELGAHPGRLENAEAAAATPIRGAMSTSEHGLVTHLSNEQGARYGEEVLGPIRDRVPEEQFDAAFAYTEYCWQNAYLRDPDEAGRLAACARDDRVYSRLKNLTVDTPTVARIMRLQHRDGLSSEDRQAIETILTASRPTYELAKVRSNSWIYARIRNGIGATPTPENIEKHLALLDQAVRQPLPGSVRACRDLADLRFMTVDETGTRLGDGDPRSLIGTVQTEPGYLSVSLGAVPPFGDTVRLDLDIPAGSEGLWMGNRSAFPSQRELILPRNTSYHVTDVIFDPAGHGYTYYDKPEVVIKARVVSPDPL
ncbi:ADP-ribosyltransferase [Nocardia tengchongensis]|uniref:ADP-ribosyltransferase n=1 Tax=Nocardia tengchongensis TaxID=2055889 RepID=UPI00367DC2C2